MIKVYIDGSAKPNPGKGGIGITIQGDGWDYTISEAIPGKKVTNNLAEYEALVRALTELMKNKLEGHDIQILSDSEMLILQITGKRQVDRGGAYVSSYLKAKQLVKCFSRLSFMYIPREENAEANLLASRGVNGRVD